MNGEWLMLAVCLATNNGVATLCDLWRKWRDTSRLEGLQKIDLLPSERGPILLDVQPITTVTFYSGSWHRAKEYLTRRVADIVEANPWLACRLDFDTKPEGTIAMYRDEKAPLPELLFVRGDIKHSRQETRYDDMAAVFGSTLCRKGFQSIGTGEALWKVSIVPDAALPESHFAVVVSANHSLIDGHGLYRLYRMLSCDEKVAAMDPTRRQQMPAMICEAMGGEAGPMTDAPLGFIVRFTLGALWNSIFPRTKSLVFEVCERWIAAQKEAARRAGEVPYISTNDALVSAYYNCFNPPRDMTMMSINFRNRIAGLGDDAVGNYEELMTFTPPDFATPAMIRKSVAGPRYRRAAQPPTSMPSFWTHVTRGHYCESSNWMAFASPLNLDGAEEELHLPVVDYGEAAPASVFGTMTIFRPRPGKVGVAVGGSQDLLQALAASGMVGESLGIKS